MDTNVLQCSKKFSNFILLFTFSVLFLINQCMAAHNHQCHRLTEACNGTFWLTTVGLCGFFCVVFSQRPEINSHLCKIKGPTPHLERWTISNTRFIDAGQCRPELFFYSLKIKGKRKSCFNIQNQTFTHELTHSKLTHSLCRWNYTNCGNKSTDIQFYQLFSNNCDKQNFSNK